MDQAQPKSHLLCPLDLVQVLGTRSQVSNLVSSIPASSSPWTDCRLDPIPSSSLKHPAVPLAEWDPRTKISLKNKNLWVSGSLPRIGKRLLVQQAFSPEMIYSKTLSETWPRFVSWIKQTSPTKTPVVVLEPLHKKKLRSCAARIKCWAGLYPFSINRRGSILSPTTYHLVVLAPKQINDLFDPQDANDLKQCFDTLHLDA